MVRKKYVSISIPQELAHRVDEILAEGDWGYRSRAEIINEALREYLMRLKAAERRK